MEIVSVYRGFRLDQIVRLRQAFTRDMHERGVAVETIAFCEGRIAIIDAILTERCRHG
jgi:hypothetical protein